MPACSERKTLVLPEQPEPGAGLALVVQLARLGDFLQTTPLLAAIHSRSPRPRLGVLVAPAQASLARACRQVDEVYTLDLAHLKDAAREERESLALRQSRLRGLVGPIWAAPAREVYSLNLSPLTAALASGWPGARRVGWRIQDGRLTGEPWTRFMMRLVADRRFTRLHLSDILASYAEPDGPPLARLDHRVSREANGQAEALLPGLRGPLVALQLGANNDLRRWPLANFAALAKGLLAEGCEVALVGTQRERVLARRLVRELGPAGDKVRDLMGRTDLPALAGVLAQAGLVVSADTGTLHLATAAGARVLALYMGPAQAHETGPYGAGHLVLQARDECGPCQEDKPACGGEAPCRALISPQAALAASRTLLAGAEAGEAAEGLDLPDGVEPLVGVMDGFGQRYRPLRPRNLGPETGLALALREAGRVLMRPAYAFGDVETELNSEHMPPAPGAVQSLAGLAKAANRLAGAALAKDVEAARRIGAGEPWLRPLAGLVGADGPPRLAKACQSATQVLEQTSNM